MDALPQPPESWDSTWAETSDQHFSESELSSSHDKYFPSCTISPALCQGTLVPKAFWSENTLRILPSLSFPCLLVQISLSSMTPCLGLSGRAVQLPACSLPPPLRSGLQYHRSLSRLCLCVLLLHYVSLNSISALVLWEAGSPLKARKTSGPSSSLCAVWVLCCPGTPPPPHLNSVHSQGHKSVVVGMHYEEINIYQISFQEGE